MNIFKIIALAAGLVIVSQSAIAFQEEQVGTTPDGVVVDKAPNIGDAASFDGAAGQVGAEKGLEVRIPGLGSLGVLPKMDFGLELLYGASGTPEEAKQDEENLTNENGDLRVRGTVKHRF